MMDPEFEARFLSVDVDAVCVRLRSLGAARRMPRTLMRRIVLTNQDIAGRGGWLRLRDQGENVLLTYKQVNETGGTSRIDRLLEAEVEVADFHATQRLLEAMGFTVLRYQENYREEWRLDEVIFDLDTWPGLPTYLEIEGPAESAVRSAAAMLDLDYSTARFGSVDEVYLEVLGRDILAEPRVVFAAADHT